MAVSHAEKLERRVALGTVVIPTIGVALAVLYGGRFGVPAHALLSFGVLYVLTALGITVGYHRLITHRSFQAHSWLRNVLIVLGSMAAQGPVIFWVVSHRRHHEATDRSGDPHSPHQRNRESLSGVTGFWHAHLGWMLRPEGGDAGRYARDLLRDRTVVALSYSYPIWVAVGLAIPTLSGYAATGTLHGCIAGFLFGGCARIFALHHATWLVNSACHASGPRDFDTDDQSRNVFWVALLTLGEGWHNNHHAFPTSARHGLSWWQLDVSYLVIKCLAFCNLANAVRVPSERELGRKRYLAPERALQL